MTYVGVKGHHVCNYTVQAKWCLYVEIKYVRQNVHIWGIWGEYIGFFMLLKLFHKAKTCEGADLVLGVVANLMTLEQCVSNHSGSWYQFNGS